MMKMNQEDIVISFSVGDYGGDGHMMSDTVTVRMNKLPFTKSTYGIKFTPSTSDKPQDAYSRGCEILGLDNTLDNIYCAEYDDSFVPVSIVRAAYPNFHVDGGIGYDEDEDMCRIFSAESWVRLIMNICRMGDPSFEFEIMEFQTFWVGGYGLFGT